MSDFDDRDEWLARRKTPRALHKKTKRRYQHVSTSLPDKDGAHRAHTFNVGRNAAKRKGRAAR